MASKGTTTFILQRGTAVVMLPLIIWFLVALMGQLGSSQAQMQAWLSQPVNGLLMATLVIIGAFHMRIGLSEVIDDYFQGSGRTILKTVNWVAAIAVALVAAGSVLSQVFGV